MTRDGIVSDELQRFNPARNRINRQPAVHACQPPAMRSRESKQIGVRDS